jgi:hypothetical protein
VNYCIPYKIPDLYGGFGEAHGTLTFDGRELRLEFQTQDSMFGIVKSSVRTVLVDLPSIAAMEIRKGVFRSSMLLRLTSYRMATTIPTNKNGEIRLTIAKKHFPELQSLQTEVRSALTNRDLDQLLADSRPYLDNPPPPPPAAGRR